MRVCACSRPKNIFSANRRAISMFSSVFPSSSLSLSLFFSMFVHVHARHFFSFLSVIVSQSFFFLFSLLFFFYLWPRSDERWLVLINRSSQRRADDWFLKFADRSRLYTNASVLLLIDHLTILFGQWFRNIRGNSQARDEP